MATNNQLNEMLQVTPNASAIMSKWAKELGHINEAFDNKLDYIRQANTAIMLETANNHINRMSKLNEATQATDVSYFNKYAINLIAAAIPNLIAPDLCSVQPMLSRVGELRYLQILYGNDKGKVKAGDTMMSLFQGGNGEFGYSADTVDSEVVGNIASNKLEGTLSWLPVMPGTVHLMIDSTEVKDDGKGNLKGGAHTGTIDYATGKLVLNTSGAVTTTDNIEVSYQYDNMTVPVKAPEVNIKIEIAPVIARSRKLKTLYSFDAAFDMEKDYGVQINNELVTYTASQIKHEIDGEIMNDLFNAATAKPVTWSAVAPQAVSLRDHYESFQNTIIEASNNIFQATKLASGSFILAGTGACAVMESLPRFKEVTAQRPVGPHLVGHLGTMPVYKNPYFPADQFVVGWKGSGLFDSGYIYAPYMPIMSTNLIMDANFEGQRGFATSYGKKIVNGNMYCKGTVTR